MDDHASQAGFALGFLSLVTTFRASRPVFQSGWMLSTTPDATGSSTLPPLQKKQTKPKIKGNGVLPKAKARGLKNLSLSLFLYSKVEITSVQFFYITETPRWDIHYQDTIPSKCFQKVLSLFLLPCVSAQDDGSECSAPSTAWVAAGKQQKELHILRLMWLYQNTLSHFFPLYPQRHFSVSHGITDGRPESSICSSSPSCCNTGDYSCIYFIYLLLCEREK